jgi:hypothetical protein
VWRKLDLIKNIPAPSPATPKLQGVGPISTRGARPNGLPGSDERAPQSRVPAQLSNHVA